MITADIDGKGNFYVHTDDIDGEWSEPLLVDQPGYDPSLFFDDDGRVYLTAAGGGISQCEIDITTGSRLGPSQQVWSGTGGAYPEGPHL
jgi:alpha-N-arabinofuranosidase